MIDLKNASLDYEGTLNIPGGYRVISVRVGNVQRCFAVGPNGHPLARTGFPSIDAAREKIEQFRSAETTIEADAVAPSALPPEEQAALEPLIDTVMRVEIQGIYVALLGLLLGGDALLWVLQLPTHSGARANKVFDDEATAIIAYENLCAELSTRFITAKLESSEDGS